MRKALLTTLAAAALGSVSVLAATAAVQAQPLSSDDLSALLKTATYTQSTATTPESARATQATTKRRVVYHRRVAVHRRPVVMHTAAIRRHVVMHPAVVHRRVAMRGRFVTYRRVVVGPRGRVFVARRVWLGPRFAAVGASSWRWRYPYYYAAAAAPRYWYPGYNVTSTGSIATAPVVVTRPVRRARILTTGSIAETPRQYFSPMNQLGYNYGFNPGLGYLNTSLRPDVTGSIGATTGAVALGPSPVGFATPMFSSFPEYAGQTWIAYCSHRFPTYNRWSNTFWGPDGLQHECF
ncbi:BA14K family protein [Microvirga terricola]|uniref:BA14K family protein n=1 Tax=Microvirga terricola TaxID=2719797 RepID=A0ABX0V740_9HYPH|nr:BA14K family protein [Microvirga terricola]NIX75568.1 BA14K family protein [Microvirga terricola]